MPKVDAVYRVECKMEPRGVQEFEDMKRACRF